MERSKNGGFGEGWPFRSVSFQRGFEDKNSKLQVQKKHNATLTTALAMIVLG